MENLEQTCSELKQQLATKSAALSAAEAATTDVRAELSAAESEVRSKQVELDAKQEALQEAEQKLEAAQAEIERLLKAPDALGSDLVSKLQKQVVSLEEKLARDEGDNDHNESLERARLPGQRVQLCALQGTPINGQFGLCGALDPSTGKHTVILDGSGRAVAVNPQNLKAADESEPDGPVLGIRIKGNVQERQRGWLWDTIPGKQVTFYQIEVASGDAFEYTVHRRYSEFHEFHKRVRKLRMHQCA